MRKADEKSDGPRSATSRKAVRNEKYATRISEAPSEAEAVVLNTVFVADHADQRG